MRVVVSDTSPIRALSHLDRLDLLASLLGDVIVPPAVADELLHPKAPLPPVDVGRWRAFASRLPKINALSTS